MATISLSIPNMKSQHCQLTVTAAVNALGASVKQIEPMKAEIELPERINKAAVVEAIVKAGYKVV